MTSLHQKRYSVYFMTMSMAFGLGNIWRFPYLIHEYGYGAFLSMYGILALFFGVPLIVAEVLLGKNYRERENGSSSRILKNVFYDRKIKYVWWIPVCISVLVLSYYALISSWVLHYICQIAYALLFDKAFVAETAFKQISQRPWLQALLTSVHMLLTFFLINKGQKFKINRISALILPAFLIYITYLIYSYYTYDDLLESARLLLYPNFNQLNKSSLNYALGHMLFTLSLGFGTLVSFGKTFKDDTSVTTVSSRVGLLDSGVSVLVAFMLFPMVLTLGYIGNGSEILFSVVPYYFNSIGLGLGYTLFFYVLVYIVSLSAGLGLTESIVMNVYEAKNYSKVKSASLVCNVVFFLSLSLIIIQFFTPVVSWFNYRNVILLVDDVLINFILPISVILISVSSYRFLNRKYVENEFMRNEGPSTWRFFLYWRFVIMYGFPLVFLISLVIRFM